MLTWNTFRKKLKEDGNNVSLQEQGKLWEEYKNAQEQKKRSSLGESSNIQKGPRVSSGNVVVKKNAKSVGISKLCKSNKNYKIVNQTCKIYDENNNMIGYFLKGIITDPKLIDTGRKLKTYAQKTTRRAQSAGIAKTVNTKNGGTMKLANPVYSSIVGYMEDTSFHGCRQTALYKKHEKMFDDETIKLIQFISNKFKEYCPNEYKKQISFIKKVNKNMVLKGTCYTTLTINKDFRTRSHTDKGDYNGGLGNLAVFNYEENGKIQNYKGGEFLLPDYNLGINMEEGDLLFVDVHKTHCNNPIKGKGRVSLVCYARENLEKRCKKTTKEDLYNFKVH